jgi:hypothetical protein
LAITKTEKPGKVKAAILSMCFTLVLLGSVGQTEVKLPGVYLELFRGYPLSSEFISFSANDADNKADSTWAYQHMVTVSRISDTLVSEFIYHIMSAASMDLAYKALAHGVEIWYGLTSHNLRLDYSMTGFYINHSKDSTKILIVTTYALPPHKKKPKSNFAENTGQSLQTLIDKYRRGH